MSRPAIVTLALVVLTSVASAQTATPDPHALRPGVYQVEDLAAPQIELSDGWLISSYYMTTPYPIDALVSDATARDLTLSVHDAGWVDIRHGTGSGGEMTVTIDETPTAIDLAWPEPAIITSSLPTNGASSVTITGADLFLDQLTVHGIYAEVTPVPEPWVDLVITTPDGEVPARFEYTATASDVVVIGLLVGVLMTIWAAAFMRWFVLGDMSRTLIRRFTQNWNARDV